jgi:hypothetical protein
VTWPPDLAPSDYHLLSELKKPLKGKAGLRTTSKSRIAME